MAGTTFNHQASHYIELDFSVILEYFMENIAIAKIYKYFLNFYAINIKDLHSKFNMAPLENYQGNYYVCRMEWHM